VLLIILVRNFTDKCQYEVICIFNLPLSSNMLWHLHWPCPLCVALWIVGNYADTVGCFKVLSCRPFLPHTLITQQRFPSKAETSSVSFCSFVRERAKSHMPKMKYSCNHSEKRHGVVCGHAPATLQTHYGVFGRSERPKLSVLLNRFRTCCTTNL